MNFFYRRFWRLAFLIVLITGASGCTTVLVETAKKFKEDRVTDDQFGDTKIAAHIVSALADKDKNYLLDVNADVWEARVMLTGTVPDARARREVVQAVQTDKRVKRIYDELQIVSNEEILRRREAAKTSASGKKEGADRVIGDYWIETKISAQLIAASDVSSVNFRWRSVRNTVYLIGRSHSKGEVNSAMAIIRATDGVTQVKSFVEIRS